MKKVLALLLALAMVFSFAACGKKEEPAANVGVANPITEYKSIEEINAEANVNLSTVSGASDESFTVIAGTDTMAAVAQYKFTLNGVSFTYRSCNGNYEDISGVYMNGAAAFDNFHPGNDQPIMMVGDNDLKLARWFTQDQVQYSLCADDKGKLSQEDFSKVVDELTDVTGLMIGSDVYDQLQGCYSDEINQRPYMEVESFGYEGVVIKLWWSSSAFEQDFWTMQAKYDDQMRLAYDWGTHERLTFKDENDAEGTTELIAQELSGYFTVTEDGKLIWDGAPEEEVRDCEFVKVSELEDIVKLEVPAN